MIAPRRRSGPHYLRAALLCFVAAVLVLVFGERACPDTLGDAAVVAAASADVVSTHVALQRDGTIEGNPLMRNAGARVAIKAACTTAVVWQARRWDRGGHKTRARVLRWSTVAVWGGAAAWNLTKGGGR